MPSTSRTQHTGSLFDAWRPLYHFFLAYFGALWYRFPSRKLVVIGVTGTKGKSSVVELINAVLEEAGHTTALSSTIRFKVASESQSNHFKMTMPGRFFLQKFFARAVSHGCTHAVLEMTSEGVKQFRHIGIQLDALIFTNLAPEHIESHGSYEKYVAAKLRIARALERSPKKKKVIVVNGDDKHAKDFLATSVPQKYTYTLADAQPYIVNENGIDLTYEQAKIHSPLLGTFNVYNILAAVTYARSQNIDIEVIKKAIGSFAHIPGRVEHVDEGQDFVVIVDYAHTKESLEELYQTFAQRKKICVLGNTGGGRDVWKRPEMGAVADAHCAHIILTNEDPYDEDPRAIVDDMARAITTHTPEIIMDRRKAIRKALKKAEAGAAVLITGKGTDPYIMEAGGTKTPWSDTEVVREELQNLLNTKT